MPRSGQRMAPAAGASGSSPSDPWSTTCPTSSVGRERPWLSSIPQPPGKGFVTGEGGRLSTTCRARKKGPMPVLDQSVELQEFCACNSARSPRPILRSRSGAIRFFDPQHGANTNVVLRARDPQKLALAKHGVEDMLEPVRRAQSNSACALSRRKQGFEPLGSANDFKGLAD